MSDAKNDSSDGFKRQGSLRKVLPSQQIRDAPLSMSAKMIDRPAVSPRTNKTYSLYQQEYSLLSEYVSLFMTCAYSGMFKQQNIPGVYVIPSARSSLLWFGVLFVRHGLYEGGIFRFQLIIPETFPDCSTVPRVVFQSSVFHPEIDSHNGEMNVRQWFPEWQRDVNYMWQVLDHVRTAFYKINTHDPVNKEAAEIYHNHPDQFQEQVKLCVQASLDHLYDPPPVDDPHFLKFIRYSNVLHDPVRDSIHKMTNRIPPKPISLSWVKQGTLKPFSRPFS